MLRLLPTQNNQQREIKSYNEEKEGEGVMAKINGTKGNEKT